MCLILFLITVQQLNDYLHFKWLLDPLDLKTTADVRAQEFSYEGLLDDMQNSCTFSKSISMRLYCWNAAIRRSSCWSTECKACEGLQDNNLVQMYSINYCDGRQEIFFFFFLNILPSMLLLTGGYVDIQKVTINKLAIYSTPCYKRTPYFLTFRLSIEL